MIVHSDLIGRSEPVVLVKLCGGIPEGFHGEWKTVGTDKVVEFKSKYYRAYGAHGNDPFCMSIEALLDYHSLLHFYYIMYNYKCVSCIILYYREDKYRNSFFPVAL